MYFILTAGVESAKWLLVFVLIISSVIGLFYYLRLMATMMKKQKDKNGEKILLPISALGVLVLAVMGILIIWLGVYPTWLMNLVNSFTFAPF